MSAKRVLVVLVLAGVLAVTSTGTPADAAGARSAAVDPRGSAASQSFYWRWSDGSTQKSRTFRRSDYRVPERLPVLIVSARPVTPRRTVELQYLDHGSWRTDDTGRTDATGAVRLALNPYCPDGSWCERTFSYRAAVGARTTSFRLTFAH